MQEHPLIITRWKRRSLKSGKLKTTPYGLWKGGTKIAVIEGTLQLDDYDIVEIIGGLIEGLKWRGLSDII